MKMVCLDLEGVLVPEIWIAFACAAGIDGLRRTTRDEPDYDKLMRFRIGVLAENGLKLADIQAVIRGMEPLPGAAEFAEAARGIAQLVILSDTFEEFAGPLLERLNRPTILCNSLETAPDGTVTGYRLRQKDGKREAVRAFKSMNLSVFAAGDSFNDISMIRGADAGCLFRPPDAVKESCRGIKCVEGYGELLAEIKEFLGRGA